MRAEQGTEQWLLDRLGHLTASRMADVMATTKSGPSASRRNYMAQLVAERLTGVVAESFCSSAMEWGTSNEPLARAEYEITAGEFVDQDGFIKHQEIEWCGASCDGFVGKSGLVEIKCPNTATHIDYLLGQKPPSKYVPQMLLQLACTGMEWCDFVSYDPRMPEKHRLFVVRFEPKRDEIEAVEDAARGFLAEVQETIDRLNGIKHELKAAA
ncbi:MAG: YqaJ viral recombinase family protein [Pseudomonadota bacterium]|nr:YqaJ viral recombinase family protein [Pseudomonadota bacterium]